MNPKELVMVKVWNQWKQYLLAVALISATVWAAAQPATLDIPGEGTIHEPLGSTYATPKQLNPKAARVTIYRPALELSAGVAHLVINGQYHSSLQPGAYSEVCLLPRELTLDAYMVQAELDNANVQASVSFQTKAAQNYYVRLNDKGNRSAVIAPVSDKAAQRELQNTRRQIHVATRVTDLVECVEYEEVPAPKITPVVLKTENITLASDALFGFGKSDINGISAEGRIALGDLIAKLQKQYGNLPHGCEQRVDACVIGAVANQRKRLSA